MPLVGVLDLAVAALLLVRPLLPLLLWCVAWTVFTAALRPLSGMGMGEPSARTAVRKMGSGCPTRTGPSSRTPR